MISDEDFWEARRNLFTDVVARKATGQKRGIENALDADLKGARDGMSDTVINRTTYRQNAQNLSRDLLSVKHFWTTCRKR